MICQSRVIAGRAVCLDRYVRGGSSVETTKKRAQPGVKYTHAMYIHTHMGAHAPKWLFSPQRSLEESVVLAMFTKSARNFSGFAYLIYYIGVLGGWMG